MDTRRQKREKSRLRSRRARALLAGGLVLGVGAAATIAAWTDQELASTTVSAGTFSIVSRTSTAASFSPAGSGTNTVTFTADLTGMYPGVKKAQVVQVQAGGSLAGTVNITAVAVTNNTGGTPIGADLALQNALRVDVSVVANPTTCVDTLPMPSGSLTTVPAVAQQALTAGPVNTVTYCVVVGLPTDASGLAQGGIVKPTWTFTGSTN